MFPILALFLITLTAFHKPVAGIICYNGTADGVTNGVNNVACEGECYRATVKRQNGTDKVYRGCTGQPCSNMTLQVADLVVNYTTCATCKWDQCNTEILECNTNSLQNVDNILPKSCSLGEYCFRGSAIDSKNKTVNLYGCTTKSCNELSNNVTGLSLVTCEQCWRGLCNQIYTITPTAIAPTHVPTNYYSTLKPGKASAKTNSITMATILVTMTAVLLF